MILDKIFKPEYLYQPKIALQRMLPFRPISTDEFIEYNLPWGMQIRVRPQEEHGKILTTLGIVDLAVTETLWRLAEPGELVIDVGANIGYMTSILAARVSSSSGGCVWAFEAHPEIFLELKYNVEKWQKQLSNIKFCIKNIAISEQEGTVQLHIPDSFATNRGLASVVTTNEFTDKSIILESCSLDSLFSETEQIGVMKLDVEGHELQVLKGAKNLLQQKRIRDCVFEEHNEYPTSITTFFESMGYRVFRIHRNFAKPMILPPNSKLARTSWQPTSFLATTNPERVINAFNKSGWQVLKSIKSF